MIIQRNTDGTYSAFQRINGRLTIVEGASIPEVMRTVCAWCEATPKNEIVSHGICDNCAESFDG